MANAVNFIKKIKVKCSLTPQMETPPQIYLAFIDVMKKQENGEQDLNQIQLSVQELLVDYPHLLEEFKVFLPDFVIFLINALVPSMQRLNLGTVKLGRPTIVEQL
jgi:histone deacetylase complex regulatory component SIN3